MNDNPETSRPKRQKAGQTSRFEALAKLKKLKSDGTKHKYEVEPMKNVYEEISEQEYTDRVVKRQQDNWIVDDFDVDGYVEDGREIFDDDLDEESIVKEEKKGRGKKRSRADKSFDEDHSSSNRDIQKMFANMPIKKKKEVPVNLNEDDILDDLIQELDKPGITKTPRLVHNKVSEKIKRESQTRGYLESFSTVLKSPRTPVNNIIIKTENADENIESQSSKLNNSDDVNKNNFQAKELSPEPIKKSVSITENPIKQELFDESMDDCIEDFDFEEAIQAEKSFMELSELNVKKELTKTEIKIEFEETKWPIENVQEEEQVALPHDISSKLPLTSDKNGTQVFRFFYLDAFEDVFKQPGVVFLFGKVKPVNFDTYVSCCVVVKNIERRMFLLPRNTTSDNEEVKMVDVYNEFNNLTDKYQIQNFKSRKITKKYAFDLPDVADESEYLEIRYSASHPPLPEDLSGKTFSRVFGTNTSFLELLLLDQKIKGPCWLDIKIPQLSNNPMSWCKIEVLCSDMKNIQLAPTASPPPIVIMTLNPRITYNKKTKQNEIIILSCLVHTHFPIDQAPQTHLHNQFFCAISRPSNIPWPLRYQEELKKCGDPSKIIKMDSERALLTFFLAKLSKIDPDMIIGHDICSYILSTLVGRLEANKIQNWSKIGRLRRTLFPKKGKFMSEKSVLSGRLICDTQISAKELIKARSYDLYSLSEQILNVKENEHFNLSDDEVSYMYCSAVSLMQLIKFTIMDTSCIMRLMCQMNVLPLALQITKVAGNLLSRTLIGGRAERNEYLLLHAFNEKGYILPDKQYKKRSVNKNEDNVEEENTKKNGRKKAQYLGGLVLDPKIGFYDKMILLMDFNSLYPSIIQEYNICFTTVSFRTLVSQESDDEIAELLKLTPNQAVARGILPAEIKSLVDSRREVKKLMNDPKISATLKEQYNLRQTALKLTANSMYGCLGFTHSRFYAKPLAALITAKGREILISTKALVEKLSFDVIYGDTDSLMINSNCVDYDQVMKIGFKIKAEVNKMYKQVELDIDGIFKYMLLLKKKKYAAISISKLPSGEFVTKEEIKGLDIVRRDWSQLSQEAGRFVLRQILSDQSPEERVSNICAQLEKLRVDCEGNNVPLGLLAISKTLTKAPQDYSDSKALPHVAIAQRLNKQSIKFRQGDTVSYVVCEDGTNFASNQRVYHVDELKNNTSLKIDFKYYLSQQIHPVIMRLCAPLENIDAKMIAEYLGLDPAQYQNQRTKTIYENSLEENAIDLDDATRFSSCDPFKFKCLGCNTEVEIIAPAIKTANGKLQFSLENCSNSECYISPYKFIGMLENTLWSAIRKHTIKFYKSQYVCDENTCDYKTKYIPRTSDEVCIQCESGTLKKEYSVGQLLFQLRYYLFLFDIDKVLLRNREIQLATEDPLYIAYSRLKAKVQKVLKHHDFYYVNLKQIFGQY
ncbi:DNA polymerase alpha catalytic subunit [Myzus persicae]|uniref:DNA polymerase alpha catalytic subunit n=1 Tax=Myzus persicae TaxID=13164 RepID=UPI000B934D3E|nr:DNA polymerase alpha catalytic subunit [Myzus persicae]